MEAFKISAMRNSDDPLGSSEPLIRNADSPSLEQLNYSAKLRNNQLKLHQKEDRLDHEKADIDLDNEISLLEISNINELSDFLEKYYPNNSKAKVIAEEYFNLQLELGRKPIKLELKEKINTEITEESNLSIEDKIKNYTESIKDGKSPQEILQLLIAKFESAQGTEKLISNFKGFLKLHQFAENKPPKERRAILSIINKAQLYDEDAFTTSLNEIANSSEISTTTKLELSREFVGEHIDSVDGMDFQLKEIKSHTNAIKQELKTKSLERETLDDDIEALENELDSLPLDSPKRQELEEKIEHKKEVLQEIKITIESLQEVKPNNISFQLREGFSAIQNPDGSRSIKLNNEGFSIKLPSNKWLFSDKKNLRAINLTFPYKILKNQSFADLLFIPNLQNNAEPSLKNLKTGHLILDSLGFDDTKILSEEKIKQLKKDLSFLKPQKGKTGLENLIELGVFDVGSQTLNNFRLIAILKLTRDNRGLNDELLYTKMMKN